MPLEPNVEVKAEGSNVTVAVQESYAVDAVGKLVQVYVDASPVNVHIEESVTTSQVAGIVNIYNTYTGGGGDNIGGAVYITDVTPVSQTDNIGNKVFDESGSALESCLSTGSTVIVHILAMTGPGSLKPSVTVNGGAIPLVAASSTGFWEGSGEVQVPGDGLLKAAHSDGATWTTEVSLDSPPVILTASFTGNYPGTQTELKENDVFTFSVTADEPFVELEVGDFGAFKAKTVSLVASTSLSSTGTIADRGTTPQALPFKVRVRSATGAYSAWFTSTATVVLNNAKPQVSFTSVIYPASQQALKNSETATVNLTASGFDTIAFTSTELSIASQNSYASQKTVTRIAGSYNVSTNNLSVTLVKQSNNSVATASTLVKIANIAPTLSVSVPYARLRSGGSFGTTSQPYSVSVTSNQILQGHPSLTAPSGTLSGTWSGGGSIWQTTLSVNDTDTKGTFSWGGITALGLSGLSATGSGSYTIGGFVCRTVTIGAWPVRSAQIGTAITDVSKLRCSNLSKGTSGSFNFTYQLTTAEALNKFTVLGGSEWYNCDGLNAASNTTGTMLVEIEEVA